MTLGIACLHSFKRLAWAARYNTWLLIKLTPKGVVFSFSFLKDVTMSKWQVVCRCQRCRAKGHQILSTMPTYLSRSSHMTHRVTCCAQVWCGKALHGLKLVHQMPFYQLACCVHSCPAMHKSQEQTKLHCAHLGRVHCQQLCTLC